MILRGKSVSPGIVFGKLRFTGKAEAKVEKRATEDVAYEIERFEKARSLAAAQLRELAVSTEEQLGEHNSQLFESHRMMLEDLDYLKAVKAVVQEEKVCAEYAVEETCRRFSELFSTLEDEYMRGRAADVVDVSRRVITLLCGREQEAPLGDGPLILAAEEFTPSETALLDRDKVLAMVARSGSVNSHAAIFARTMEIPAIAGLGEALASALDGCEAAVDGETGELFISPGPETRRVLCLRRQEKEEEKQRLKQHGGVQGKAEGHTVPIYANVGLVQDAKAALAGGAAGVGLMRSEFLYFGQEKAPGENEQYEVYRAVAEAMAGREVIVRTLDIGADKQLPYLKLPVEENPALGIRGVRVYRRYPGLLKTQLRALYRASAHGRIGIMLPMVTALEEVRWAKQLAAEVREELRQENILFAENVPFGIMVETPAAAVISDILAKEADFFSIGTNDLCQYTLAADRRSLSERDAFCCEAVQRLIKMTVENAHRAGIWVSVCGEMAADPETASMLVSMGVDRLSVLPSAVLPLRRQLAEAN